MNHTIDTKRNVALLDDIGKRLSDIENELYATIGGELAKNNPGRDPGKCNVIFGHFTRDFLMPCNAHGLLSRAALAGDGIIEWVIAIEKEMGNQFHKGALFHDTAIAHFLCGNVDKYEYLLAMAAEEDVQSVGGSRENLNLQKDALTGQTITERLQCACELLNGKIAGYPANYAFLTGLPPISPAQLDSWRQNLNSLEQFEFLRIIHDIYQFVGTAYPDYEPVKDNPFVMLRLAKTLSHLAQWIESNLTRWQGSGGSLSPKLKLDADFGATLSAAAGNQELFAGNCPHGADVDTELSRLMTELLAEPAGSPRNWRLLRILYIVRNSTAHTIDPALAMYSNRTILLNLIQAVFVSVFAIAQLKKQPMP